MHEVIWNSKKISEFWTNNDLLIARGIKENDYFGEIYSPAILDILNEKVCFRNKKVLDYGCGVGSLIKRLLEDYKPELVMGCDLSEESCNETDKRCIKFKSYKGSFNINENEIKKYENFFDCVLLSEVIEHLDDETLKYVINNITRMLRPNGIICITTPNDEELSLSLAICPDCGCYFHRHQHIRSWNKNSLTQFMTVSNYVLIETLQSSLKRRNTPLRKLYSRLYDIIAPKFGRKLIDLFWIGKKISDNQNEKD